MFPIKSSDAYIKENGKRSTIGAELNTGSGGGSDLPEHSIADAGKVLTVGEDGELEWDDAGGGVVILSGTTDPVNSEGEDGDIYLFYGSEALSSFSIRKESSMTITVSDASIVFDYTSGVSLGGQAYKQIDLTDVDTISYSMTSGSHSYDNYQTAKFCPLLIIENTKDPANSFVADSVAPVEGSRITADNKNVTLEVDVSSLTGNYWVVFCSYGCDSTVDYFKAGANKSIVASYLKVNGAWQNLIGSDIDDVG